jgi:LmbE family N-acetylglucosaminyl deacetylase
MSSAENPRRILAIHAHPDDIEFQCAGTLALLKEKGHQITYVTMTAGDGGSAEMGPDEISETRRGEARKAAAMLEADFYCLEFRDLSIVNDNPSRRRVTELFRRVEPDLVITAPPIDYMSDHEVTSTLVKNACFNASVPNYRTREWDAAEPNDHIPHLYYVDSLEGIDYFGNPIEPDFIVDITKTFDLKLEMLACHESQRNWLRKQHGVDEYLDSCKRWAAERGEAIGTEYGEGFRQHVGHPYPNDNLLLELLEA